MIFTARAVFGAAALVLTGTCMSLGSPTEGSVASPGGPGAWRLANVTSPYLLQHKDNPVDWHPWGDEALQAARAQNKPIFLSIGYSACHWCHVMEEESFEDPNTAEVMRRYFVSIKVDREERPDLDDIYMTSVQMMTGSGGWPMSVWLTPDLKPFYGGTYFPKDARYGRPSFVQVLTALGESWASDRASLISQADRVADAVKQHMSGGRAPGVSVDLSPALVERAVAEMTRSFDHVNGGFGGAPKFPPARGLSLMLARFRQTRDENLLRMATLTFDRMALGGMYDQIGGGFHRYATDARWQVPHFEKMLYDNALLLDGYLEAWQVTGLELYQRVAREIMEWVAREMTSPDGAFYSSQDADSEGEEGRFYVWKPAEVTAVLGEAEAALVCQYYGITTSGNFEGNRSIPHIDATPDSVAARLRITPEELRRRVDAGRAKLLEARGRRVWPHRDGKILTAWNGLMIAAAANAGRILREPGYTAAAARAAGVILSKARGADGLLRVSHRGEQVSQESFLDDQAFMLRALLALREADSAAGERWLAEARAVEKAADAAFRDPVQGGYFFTPPGRADLLVRPKNPADSAIPSGNSMMAACLVRLAAATGEKSYRDRAAATLAAFSGAMETLPAGFHNMLGALNDYLASGPVPAVRQVVEVAVDGAAQPIAAGSRATTTLTIKIAEGWHINSSQPTLDYLIPTAVNLDAGSVELVEARFPEGAMVKLGFAAKAISVYTGATEVPLLVAVPAGAPAGRRSTSGKLSYQACNETACLAPAQVSFAFDLVVRPASE